jgi:hypothetical protein
MTWISKQEVQNHLDQQLAYLDSEREILVSSRWPGLDKVVCQYPTNVFERITLFFKTLHFRIPTADKNAYQIKKSIESLKIYREAVEYQIETLQSQENTAARSQHYLLSEERHLKTLQPILQTVIAQLSQGRAPTHEQKEELYDLASSLTETFSPIDEKVSQTVRPKGSLQDQLRGYSTLEKEVTQRLQEISTLKTASPTSSTSSTPSLSLLRYLNQEQARPEIVGLNQQVNFLVQAWPNYASKETEDRQELTRFVEFFEKLHDRSALSSYPDVAHGYAYSCWLREALQMPSSEPVASPYTTVQQLGNTSAAQHSLIGRREKD